MNDLDLHILESQRRGRGVGNGTNEIGEEAYSNSSAADIRGEYLRHPDERGSIDTLIHDNVDINDQDTGGETGLVVAPKVLPLKDAFKEEAYGEGREADD